MVKFTTVMRTTDISVIAVAVRKRLRPFDNVFLSLLKYNGMGIYVPVGETVNIIPYSMTTEYDYAYDNGDYVQVATRTGAVNYANIYAIVREVIPTPDYDALSSHLKYTAHSSVEEWVDTLCNTLGVKPKRRTAWLCKYYGKRRPAPRYKTDVVFLYTFEVTNVKLKHDPFVADLLRRHGIDAKKAMSFI